MTRFLWILTYACLPALLACQSEHQAAVDGTKRVSTLPASLSKANPLEVHISVPRLEDAGVAANLRQALMALPQVTQVLPNLTSKEVLVRTREAVPQIQFYEVLQKLGLQGTVR